MDTLQMDTLHMESRAKWERDFPGSGTLLQTIRETVVFADSAAIQSRSALETFQIALGPLLPQMHALHPRILQRFHLLKRLHSADLRLLMTTLAALREVFAAQPARKPNELPPFVPKAPLRKGPFYQNILVTVVDGKVTSEFDIGARHWLKTRPVHLCDSWVRHYYFPNAEIPKEYAFVLEHKGVSYPPARSVYISYPPEEFLRMCQLEVDTDSEHALDGTRLAYKRLPDEEPIEEPSHEEN